MSKLSKHNQPSPSDPEDAPLPGVWEVIQRRLAALSPAAQGGLMLLGLVVAGTMVWLAFQLASNGRLAAMPAGAPTPLPGVDAATSATPPSQADGAASSGAGLAVEDGSTATLAPPATLKPIATKVPTGTPLPTPTTAPTETPLPTPTPTSLPVPDWRATGKLTSIEYINTIVIERERSKTGIDVVIPGQDRIVLQVVGNIHAGIDLNKIKPENVQIKGTSIRMVLPRAEIISVELLPEASRIYEADQAVIFSDYQGLEMEAMNEARQKLRENSTHNQKMLEMAETLARLQLTELLRSLGYEQIEIVFE